MLLRDVALPRQGCATSQLSGYLSDYVENGRVAGMLYWEWYGLCWLAPITNFAHRKRRASPIVNFVWWPEAFRPLGITPAEANLAGLL